MVLWPNGTGAGLPVRTDVHPGGQNQQRRFDSARDLRIKSAKKRNMQSFRTELENPVVEKEIFELGEKIHQYRNGSIPEEKFRSLRLARGVYGQRQQGVQMVRIKLPFGRLTVNQLVRIAD